MKFRISLIIMVLIIETLACGIPTSGPEPSIPEEKVVEASPQVESYDSPTLPLTKTEPPATSTLIRIPAALPSKTLLPPLPDFEEVLTFGGAGTGQICNEDRPANTIEVAKVKYGKNIIVCFWLRDVNYYQPFKIELSYLNDLSFRLVSPNLYIDFNNMDVLWEGYRRRNGMVGLLNDGSIALYDISLRFPINLPTGQWRISFLQEGNELNSFSEDFYVTKQDGPYIGVNVTSSNEIVPSNSSFVPQEVLRLNEKKQLNVSGIDFPSSRQIYLLLYANINGLLKLRNKFVAFSDYNGSINLDLPGPFYVGESYLLVGVFDPERSISLDTGDHALDPDLPFDYFIIDEVANFVGYYSCPGAPPQRMVINQRGYVCTQRDNVLLRDAPARSANTIISLPVSTEFTVVSGPSCADNWSWWQIQTDDGYSGWISEGGDEVDPYFICPLQ